MEIGRPALEAEARRVLRRLGLAALAFAAAGCGTTPTPSPSPVTSQPQTLFLENRGGPAYVVRINGTDTLTVPCDGYPTVSPGQTGVPELPWTISIRRQRDGVVIYTGQLTRLPGWFVQIGASNLPLSLEPIAGPPGPSCPPSG